MQVRQKAGEFEQVAQGDLQAMHSLFTLVYPDGHRETQEELSSEYPETQETQFCAVVEHFSQGDLHL